ncbi:MULTISPECIES: hypothetical protein [unclassified Pseudofrankia]|uniref:hypothetical protein n=1 Tax=unclassified Pseudofrankia TaxID=2994372 RepID=UPI0008D9123D|nr:MULTISPECIES: hypothetical protein [unclassified Pseudofrankia]MDT3442429.1 hypothetical protein [Pseudofrankia sp. BMG5.37]OHV48964.1 hypothetical protein BCD48_14075 [Pseudofrankia sp. BMG5.36]
MTAVTTARVAPQLPASRRPRWIRSAGYDLTVAALWVPFALAAWAVSGNAPAVRWLVAATLMFSVMHQPLTLLLVYGDRRQFATRRAVFVVSPFVLAGLVLFGLYVSLALLAVIAATWNAVHTLQQRYGLTRIYGRKAGDSHGNLERMVLYGALVTAVLAAAAADGTADKIAAADLGGANRRALDLLTDAAPVARVLLPFAALFALVALARWVLAERRHATANPAKWIYVGSTLALIALIAVNPLLGFVAYVGAHAAEYFLIVHHHLEGRYRPRAKPGAPAPDTADLRTGPVSAVVRSRAGRTGFLAAYLAGIGAVLAGLTSVGYPYFTLFVLIAGGLHLFYDGLIWKLRRPDVGRGFGLPGGTAGATPAPTAAPGAGPA